MAESYDRELKDIFSLQDEVILKISRDVGESDRRRASRAWAEGTKSLEAYLKLMQGREYRYKGNRESIALARRMAEDAIAAGSEVCRSLRVTGCDLLSRSVSRNDPPQGRYPEGHRINSKGPGLEWLAGRGAQAV